MEARRFTSKMKNISKQIGNVLITVVVIAIVQSFFNWNTLSIKAFLGFFLNALIGIIFIILPPIYINLYWLIPKFLIKKSYLIYGALTILICILWGYIISYIEPLIDYYLFNMPYEKDNSILVIVVMLFFALLTLLINLSYRWYIQRSQIQQVENDRLQLELALLKNQINPHFFFNTLNNLYALALEKSDDTPGVILKLSEIMRYTIYDCKEQRVPIESEILYLDNFIALQNIRHNGRGDIKFHKAIVIGSKGIAPMILIVFLENAFKHGFENIMDNAFLKISLITNRKELYFEVENNYKKDKLNRYGGLGLKNVKRRLSLIYPGKHHLNITDIADVYKVKLKILF